MNMRIIFNRFISVRMRFIQWILLWCIGILFGILIATHTAPVAAPLLQGAITSRASIISLVLISGISVLLIVVALNRSFTFLVSSLILSAGISKGLVGMLVYLVFGSGAWVLRIGLLFTSSATTFFMWWLLSKYYKQKQQNLYRDCIFAAIFLSFVSALDAFVISPFMTGLSI